MRRITKRVIGMMSAALVGVAALVPGTVMASNYTDTSWSFSTGSSGSGFATDARDKQDSSYVYIKCQSSTSGAYVNLCPYGLNPTTGTFVRNEYNGNYNQIRMVTAGTSQLKYTNYIRETGCVWTKVNYSVISGYSTFSGVWSPDTV